MNTILMPIPTKIPNCKGKTKQAIKVAKPGIKSDSINEKEKIKED